MTPEQITAAGQALAEAELGIRRGTVTEAARRALRPGGPPLDVLEQRIAAIRAADRRTRTPAPAVATPVPRRGRVTTSRRRSA